MIIKVYIVTYNNPNALNENLKSLFVSTVKDHDFSVNIIQNNTRNPLPNLSFLDPPRVKIMKNVMRPNWATGHLARNWNQAIIHGIQNLRKPNCDILVTLQDDTILAPTWLETIIEKHKTYSFITSGWGDNFVSYTPDAVRKIGIWDERYCSLGNQEGDYFLRALMFNKDKSSINDHVHKRLLNVIQEPIAFRPKITGNDYSVEPSKFNNLTMQLFEKKWGIKSHPWQPDFENIAPIMPKEITWVTYPYFEKHLEEATLRANNYFQVFP